jgi:hypothetical protein
MILLQLCQKKGRKGDSDNNSGLASQASASAHTQTVTPEEQDPEDEEEIEEEEGEPYDTRSGWRSFVSELQELQDPLIHSIFSQAEFKQFDATSHKVMLAFAKELIFFNDWLKDTEKLWLPLLQKQFGEKAVVDSHFILAAPAAPQIKSEAVAAPKIVQQVQAAPQKSVAPQREYTQQQRQHGYAQNQSYVRKNSAPTIVRGKTVVPQTLGEQGQMLLKYFPGTVTETVESAHG